MAANPIAPELPPTLQWLNVQQAPALDKLLGRVVLLHFFNAERQKGFRRTREEGPTGCWVMRVHRTLSRRTAP